MNDRPCRSIVLEYFTVLPGGTQGRHDVIKFVEYSNNTQGHCVVETHDSDKTAAERGRIWGEAEAKMFLTTDEHYRRTE